MPLFDNINLDSIKDKVAELAQSGMAKSKQLAEIVKLKASNRMEEDAIKKAYQEIGKLYYAERGLAPEGAYVALCEKITAAKCAIEENNARIEELKEKEQITEAEVIQVEEACGFAPEEEETSHEETSDGEQPAQEKPE